MSLDAKQQQKLHQLISQVEIINKKIERNSLLFYGPLGEELEKASRALRLFGTKLMKNEKQNLFKRIPNEQ